MKGVIVYADDDVLNVKDNSLEYQLYDLFRQDDHYTIIPITSIVDLEETVKSVSPIRVLMLDWQFKRMGDMEDGLVLPDETPEIFLRDSKLFSLIYIFSKEELSVGMQESLKAKFGNKIQFQRKPKNTDDITLLYNQIIGDIEQLDQQNKQMSVTYDWSQRINVAQQKIFNELDSADPTWIKVLSDAAREDTGDATTDVVNMYQELLSEQLRQDAVLRQAIETYHVDDNIQDSQSIAKLYQRLIYSKVEDGQTLMTGDICKMQNGKYAIVITPECEMRHRENKDVEILEFGNDFMEIMPKRKNRLCPLHWFTQLNLEKKKTVRKMYNNDDSGLHILPSFPFEDGVYNKSVIIEFRTALGMIPYNTVTEHRIGYRLNAPYIQQLRQRFLSFFGRCGVPAVPDILRDYNLNW